MDILKTNLMAVIKEDPEYVMALVAGDAICCHCVHQGKCLVTEEHTHNEAKKSITYIDCVRGNMEWLRQEATK